MFGQLFQSRYLPVAAILWLCVFGCYMNDPRYADNEDVEYAENE